MSISSLQKLKTELGSILKDYYKLRINYDPNCSNDELRDVAWIIQDYVNQNPEVIEEDNKLKDWLDKYRFHLDALTRSHA